MNSGPSFSHHRTANLLVKRRSQDAPIDAAKRADAMLEKGDLEGCAVWKRVLRAAEELLSKERPPVTGAPRAGRAPGLGRRGIFARWTPSEDGASQ